MNRYSLLHLTFIYCHLLNTTANCHEQTVALYRRLTVCVRRSNYVLTGRCNTFCLQNFTQRARRLQSRGHPPCITLRVYSTSLDIQPSFLLNNYSHSNHTFTLPVPKLEMPRSRSGEPYKIRFRARRVLNFGFGGLIMSVSLRAAHLT